VVSKPIVQLVHGALKAPAVQVPAALGCATINFKLDDHLRWDQMQQHLHMCPMQRRLQHMFWRGAMALQGGCLCCKQDLGQGGDSHGLGLLG
jgi:hypothetical protein